MEIFFNSNTKIACNYLQTAWLGESPSCNLTPAAREVLDPSIYRYSLTGRTALCLRGITMLNPLTKPLSDLVANCLEKYTLITSSKLNSTTPPRIDREYRQFSDAGLVANKLQNERALSVKEGEKPTTHKLQFTSKKILSQQLSHNNTPSIEKTNKPAVVKGNTHSPWANEKADVHHNGIPIHVETAYTQGKRNEMEDEHIATTFKIHLGNKTHDVALFGIFDGHLGDQSCTFVKEHLVSVLKYYLQRAPLSDVSIFNALKLAFVDLDHRFVGSSGTCAATSLIVDGNLWVANVGDSRTVLDNGGHTEQLSRDAKPNRYSFYKRIIKRAGEILRRNKTWRINGSLAVGGAIGDHSLKGALGFGCVTPRPKITKTPLKEIRKNSRLIIGCDGLWDVASSKEVVESKKNSVELMKAAYRSGSSDNISVMTIDLSTIL